MTHTDTMWGRKEREERSRGPMLPVFYAGALERPYLECVRRKMARGNLSHVAAAAHLRGSGYIFSVFEN